MKKTKNTDIRIIVAGSPKKGKSTVLQIIAKAIAEAGLDLEIRNNPGDYTNPIVLEEFQDRRIMALEGTKPKIVLEERHFYKSIPGRVDKIFGVIE